MASIHGARASRSGQQASYRGRGILAFGPLRGAVEQADHYRLWDLEGKRKPLNIVVAPDDVVSMTALGETFEPAEIITWSFKPKAWHVPRDWRDFS